MSAIPIIKILRDGQLVRSVLIEQSALLGRSEGCLIRLDDRAISRQHAVFRRTPEGLQVEKKSEFGQLIVNGVDTTSALIREGDVIRLGPFELSLQTDEPLSGVDPQTQSMVIDSSPIPADPANEPTPLPTFAEIPLEDSVSEPFFESLSEENPTPEPQLQEPQLNGALELESAPQINEQAFAEAPAPPAAEAYSPPAPEQPMEMSSPNIDPPQVDTPPPEPIEFEVITQDGPTVANQAAQVDVFIEIPAGMANVERLNLTGGRAVLGRDPSCDVVLFDKKSSRKHAEISRAGVCFEIKDLDSANGIWVCGQRTMHAVLESGDVIRIGSTEMTFRALNPEYQAAVDSLGPVASSPNEVEEPQTASYPPVDSVEAPQVAAAVTAAAFETPIAGVGAKKLSPIAWFRALPPTRRIIWSVMVLGALALVLFDETPEPKTKVVVKEADPKAVVLVPSAETSATPAAIDWKAQFEKLTNEQKKFVQEKRDRAREFFRNRQFDQTLSELNQVFGYLPEYEDCRELERYARDEIRKVEIQQEEAKKQAEKERAKIKLAQLIQEVSDKMSKKQYPLAKDLFSEIRKVDPENAQVQVWEKTIREYEEALAEEVRRDQEKKNANAQAWGALKVGIALKQKGNCHSAISAFKNSKIYSASDRRPASQAKSNIEECRAQIESEREPAMAEGKSAEDQLDWGKAVAAYETAAKIDPEYRPAFEGADRARKVLHDRAKGAYTEAVLAESYSDFETASKKYTEILHTVSKDDLYYERAQRKLSRLNIPKEKSSE